MLSWKYHDRKARAISRPATALVILLSSSFAVTAQEPAKGFSVGVGVANTSGIYIGEDQTAAAVPILRYDSDAFSISVTDGVRFTVFDQRDLRLSAVIAPRFSEIGTSDAAELVGLDRDITADAGLQVSYSIGELARLDVQALTELTDEHGGSELSLSLSRAVPIGRVPLLLEGGVTWQSDALSSYLYGVSAAEATSARAAYDPGDVVIPHISVGTAIPITDNIQVVGSIRAEFLPDAVSTSPIIDEDVSVRGLFGLRYSF